MNRQELKYIVFAILISFVIFTFIIPKFVDGGENMDAVSQFLVFNIGLFIVLQVFLKAITLNRPVKFTSTLGLLLLFISLDIMAPPLAISTSGQLLSGMTLSASASDYFFGVLGQSIGIHGFFLYIFVYIIVPAILLLIASKLLPNFVREI